jgi:hypothetical protein
MLFGSAWELAKAVRESWQLRHVNAASAEADRRADRLQAEWDQEKRARAERDRAEGARVRQQWDDLARARRERDAAWVEARKRASVWRSDGPGQPVRRVK